MALPKGKISGSDPAASLLALRAQHNASIHTLWAVYSAVGGAAAAFGSSASINPLAAVAVTLMFWVFTGGHLALLRQSLRASDAVRLDIEKALDNKALADSLLQATLVEGAHNSNPVSKNTVIHLLLDGFITAAIWAKLINERGVSGILKAF